MEQLILSLLLHINEMQDARYKALARTNLELATARLQMALEYKFDYADKDASGNLLDVTVIALHAQIKKALSKQEDQALAKEQLKNIWSHIETVVVCLALDSGATTKLP